VQRSNLRKINNQLPNPYVKLYLGPEEKATKEKRHRSSTMKSTCNPVFEEKYGKCTIVPEKVLLKHFPSN